MSTAVGFHQLHGADMGVWLGFVPRSSENPVIISLYDHYPGPWSESMVWLGTVTW